MSKEEPKVTECWTEADIAEYPNIFLGARVAMSENYRPAILMWKEDYDAMIFDLESERRWAKQYFDEAQAMRRELEELRAKCSRMNQLQADLQLLKSVFPRKGT